MTAMTTVLTGFSDSVNSRTSTLPLHTAIKPQVVIEKRKVPEGNQTVVEQSVKVVCATEDADGLVLSSKISFEATARYPVLGQMTDVTAALATFADIVNGDEFVNSVNTQNWL